MKAGIWVCMGILCAAVALADEPVKARLELVRVENTGEKRQSNYGYNLVQVKDKSPTGHVPPGMEGKDIQYGVLPLQGENGGYPFALYKETGSRWYENLFIHVNEDGTLGPEEQFKAKTTEQEPVNMHPGPIVTPVISRFVIETPFVRPADSAPDYVCELHVVSYKDDDKYFRVWFYAGCYRKGKVSFNGNSYEVTLIDLTLNGRFNDFAQRQDNAWASGDGVIFVPEGTANAGVSIDTELLSPLRVIGEQLCEVSVSPDGSEMTLTPSDLPCGRLTMEPSVERLDLASERGPFRIRRTGSAVLPAGVYSLNAVTYEKDMPEDKKWTLFGIGSPESPKVEIRPGKKTKLPFGPPFTSRVTFTPGYSKDSVSLDVELCGKGYEKYSCSLSPSAGYTLRSGNITICTRSGKHLATVEPNVQQSVDAIPPPYTWNGPVPKEGVVAVWDPGLPWKQKQEKTIITPKALKDGQQR